MTRTCCKERRREGGKISTVLPALLVVAILSYAGLADGFSLGRGSAVHRFPRPSFVRYAAPDGDESKFDAAKDGIYDAVDSLAAKIGGKSDDGNSAEKRDVPRPIDKISPSIAAASKPFFADSEEGIANVAKPPAEPSVEKVFKPEPPAEPSVEKVFKPEPPAELPIEKAFKPEPPATPARAASKRADPILPDDPFAWVDDAIEFAKSVPTKVEEAKKTLESIPGEVQKTVNEIKETVDDTVETVQAIPGEVQKSVDETKLKVDKTVEDIAAVPGKVKKSVDETKQKVDQTVETVAAVPGKVKQNVDETKQKVDQTVETIAAVPGKVKKSAEETKEKVYQTIDTIQAIPGEVQKNVDETKQKVEETVEAIQAVPGNVKRSVDEAKQKVEETAKAIEDAAEKVKNFASGLSAPKSSPASSSAPTTLKDVDAGLNSEVNDALELAKDALKNKKK